MAHRPVSTHDDPPAEPERWFHDLIDAAPVMVWVAGLDAGCTYFNRPWLEFTGHSLEEESGDGWARGIHPEERQHVLREYLAAFSGREPFVLEYRLRRHDGEYRWLIDHGAPRHDRSGAFLGYIGSCVDVTDRHRAEEALRAESERFRAIADYTYDWESWLGPDGQLLWVNPAVESLTGYSIADCREMANYPLPIVHPEDRAVLEDLVGARPVLSSVNDRTFRIRRKDGGLKWAAMSWQPISASDGTPMGVRTSVRDITDRKRAEELRLEYAQKVSELRLLKREQELREQFVALVSHDLRTPVAAARASAELMLRRSDPGDPRQELALRIMHSLDRVEAMVRNLLDAGRIRAGQPVPLTIVRCDLGKLVEETLRDLRAVHGARFVLEGGGGSVLGHWDPLALRRVVENLALNAVKYGDRTAPVTVRVATHGDRVLVAVHNEGPPLPPQAHERLFEPFLRLPATPAGTPGWGLGLAVVRGLVEAHGGSVRIDSGDGRGTTFVLVLPRDARAFRTEEQPAPPG